MRYGKDRDLYLAGGCAVVLLMIIVIAMISGCAQTITCPPGTAPSYASSKASGGGAIDVTLPNQGGSASGTWDGRSSWRCGRICAAGSLFESDGVHQRCVAIKHCADEAPAEPPKPVVK